MSETVTVEDLENSSLQADLFMDGGGGMFVQHYTCVDYPRLQKTVNGKRGEQTVIKYFVDGEEVPGNYPALAAALSKPAPEEVETDDEPTSVE